MNDVSLSLNRQAKYDKIIQKYVSEVEEDGSASGEEDGSVEVEEEDVQEDFEESSSAFPTGPGVDERNYEEAEQLMKEYKELQEMGEDFEIIDWTQLSPKDLEEARKLYRERRAELQKTENFIKLMEGDSKMSAWLRTKELQELSRFEELDNKLKAMKEKRNLEEKIMESNSTRNGAKRNGAKRNGPTPQSSTKMWSMTAIRY